MLPANQLEPLVNCGAIARFGAMAGREVEVSVDSSGKCQDHVGIFRSGPFACKRSLCQISCPSPQFRPNENERCHLPTMLLTATPPSVRGRPDSRRTSSMKR